jgi:predicted ATPase/DNA-binding SARP family transcriptional activator/DNA-binding CsgD family transcriptional regulator
MRVILLGGFRVSVGARTIREDEWRLRKASDLVKLLALEPGHRMHKDRIMYLLWPKLGPKAAANNLRQALYRARRVLDPLASAAACSHYLRVDGERLALCPELPLWVDVEAFEAAAAAARRSRDPAAYRAALNLYPGDLLPEARYEDWAEARRAEARQNYLAVLVEMAEICEERGDLGSAIDALRKAVSDEPTHEEAHAHLMRLYAKSGQRYQALRQYEQLRESLRREIGTEPGAISSHLHEDIVAGRFPVARSPRSDHTLSEKVADLPRHNVPAALSSFVGRERERVEVERALAMTRLLTLTGVGGCGKTRLALEVSRDVAGTYRDGAWLTELAPLSNPELLPQAVAAGLGLRERLEKSQQPFIPSLIDALLSKELLLVLDNCEHLADACAHLAETLLGSCPGLRILATSREALGIVGEAIWAVPPLSVPDPRRPTTPEEIAATGSVLLFLDRARYRRPAFALTTQNVSAVTEICWRLDGIPLAIELAAARVGTMSAEQIAARLGDSLGLLTAGSRTAAPRQQTLRGTLDWSYELLSEPERKLFARLSVFAGGWVMEAVETVASGNGIEEGEVLDLLSRLVDKSLVTAGAPAEGEVRYGMLEPVRQYAQERLEENGEADDLRRRHAAYFLAEAEAVESELVGPQQRWWLNRLEREHDNLRVALGWSFEHGDDELGLRLGGALMWFWYTRGYLSEGRQWLETGLTANGVASVPVRAKALRGAGWLAEEQGDYEQAKAAYEESLDICRKLGDEKGVADSLGKLGSVVLAKGDYGRAARLLEETLTVLRRSGNQRDLGLTLNNLGIVAYFRDDPRWAATLFEEALYLLRKVGDVRGMAVSLNNLGSTTLSLGDSERATALFEEALVKDREVGDTRGVAASLLNLGLAALIRADYRQADGLLKESLTILREVEDKRTVVECLEAMAAVSAARGQARRAARLWGAAELLREDLGAPLPSKERAILEPHLASARSWLKQEAWEAALTEGRAMSFEEAVEYALLAEELIPPAPLASEQPSTGAQPPDLTRREKEVAALVARGLTNRQIAKELVLSERTVANHVANILKKLGLHSREQVAASMSDRHQHQPNPH